LEKVQAPDIDTSMSDIIKLKNTPFTVDVSKLETQFDTLTDEQIQEMIDKITANDR